MDGAKKDFHSLTKVDWFFEALPLASAICSTCHSAGTSKAGRGLSSGHRQRLSRHDGVDRWRAVEISYH